MSTLAPLPRLPLAQQVAARMREAIAGGVWQEILPGERELALQMEVSRPVLREALQLLAEEGVIDCRPSRPRRILQSTSASAAQKVQRPVLLLFGSDQQVTLEDPFFFATINAFERRHIELEVLPHGAVYALQRSGFFRQETVSILLSVPQSTQQWYTRHGYPALVSGSVYPGVELPSVDVDCKAVARHAVGNLLRLGHRKVACISPSRPRAGDLDSEAGFLEAMSAREGGEAIMVRTQLEPDEVIRHMRRLLRMTEPPTALFICHAQVAIVAASYAVQMGFEVPGRLSIICRDASPFLRFHYPQIAAYRANSEAAIRQLIRWTHSPPRKAIARRLTAEFEPGASLGKGPFL